MPDPTTQVVDAATCSWQQGETEGIPFTFQRLLSGDDGPEAIRLRFDECPSVYAHMHLVPQFQLVLGGTMVMPRGITLRPFAVQYTDHCVPYGPFSTTAGHDMLVLHPRPGGLLTMADPRFRKAVNLDGRMLLAQEDEQPWRGTRATHATKTLIPESRGVEVVFHRIDAGASLTIPTSDEGRYEVVLAGTVAFGDAVVGAPSLRFVGAGRTTSPPAAGPQGAVLACLSFGDDARRSAGAARGLHDEAHRAMAGIL